MSATDIDFLLKIWGASLAAHGEEPPFQTHKDLYDMIDSTPLGDIGWESFSLHFNGTQPDGQAPPWMEATYEVWFRDPCKLVRDLIANPDFKDEFDYTPFQEHNSNGNRRYHDFMSANWSWRQAVCNIHKHCFCI